MNKEFWFSYNEYVPWLLAVCFIQAAILAKVSYEHAAEMRKQNLAGTQDYRDDCETSGSILHVVVITLLFDLIYVIYSGLFFGVAMAHVFLIFPRLIIIKKKLTARLVKKGECNGI